MLRKFATLITASMILSSCGGENSPQIKSMQRKDKMLTCKEILLEMNEAEFYKSTAERNKDPKISNMLLPLGYISTYMSAEDAIGAAKARIDYLDRIYQIMECDMKNSSSRNVNTIDNVHNGNLSSYASPRLIEKSGISDNIPTDENAYNNGEIHYRLDNYPRSNW